MFQKNNTLCLGIEIYEAKKRWLINTEENKFAYVCNNTDYEDNCIEITHNLKEYNNYPDGKTIFDYMIKDTQLNPSETLFVDDGGGNIQIGQELGFLTYQPKNGEDWREAVQAILNKNIS